MVDAERTLAGAGRPAPAHDVADPGRQVLRGGFLGVNRRRDAVLPEEQTEVGAAYSAADDANLWHRRPFGKIAVDEY